MNQDQYFHSIRIDPDKCDGRMKCMRICPTQAIRIRDGKAFILEEKCIDCGECITACPNSAIIPLTDPFGELSKFRHTVAIPSAALFAQFGQEILPKKYSPVCATSDLTMPSMSPMPAERSASQSRNISGIHGAKARHFQRLPDDRSSDSGQIPLSHRSHHPYRCAAGNCWAGN